MTSKADVARAYGDVFKKVVEQAKGKEPTSGMTRRFLM